MARSDTGHAALVHAARFDPQLQVPGRPRVRRGLAISADDTQLQVIGAAKNQRFSGRSAVTVVPRMLELCDGTRTHQALADELALTPEQVFEVLALLWTSGVVEDTAADGEQTELPKHTATLISRLGDTTAGNAAWEDGARKLVDARVVILAGDDDSGAADGIARVLGADGLSVDRHLTDRADVVVLTGTPDPHLLAQLYADGIAHLRFAVQGRTAHIGPYVDPAFTACLTCRIAEDEYDERATRPGDRELAIGLLTRDLFSLLAGSTPTPLPVHWRQVDLGRSRQVRRSAPTRPGCPTCSVGHGTVRPASTAARYEAAVAFPPRRFVGVKAHQAHFKGSNLALQRVVKTWPIASRIQLPTTQISDLDQRTGCDLKAITALLTFMAGIADDSTSKVQRWTATGGNLGSVVAHVVARDVDGLAPGTYGYVPTEHSLVRLSSRTDGIDGDAPATVVLTGHFTKVARKYGAFALRIVLLDAGCALTTARRVAQARGLRIEDVPRWDDSRITNLLGTDVTEPVTAVLNVSDPLNCDRTRPEDQR